MYKNIAMPRHVMASALATRFKMTEIKRFRCDCFLKPCSDSISPCEVVEKRTVEPPIMDTEGVDNGQTVRPLPIYCPYILPPMKGQPLNNGQKLVPNVSIIQRFHCITILTN